MKPIIQTLILLVAATLFANLSKIQPADESAGAKSSDAPSGKVYGEWLIRPKPDKGADYKRLIEQKGLPLFREGGGRMVGWWNTLIGNLYEHVTIWEYDDMAAFQKAVEHLSKSEQFAEFVKLRDPLLDGEESRFLKLAPFAEKPKLPESAPYVIHEIHRVPLSRQDEYLKLMEKDGLPLLKKHGFHPVGPWLVAVGQWTDVTYLFTFASLAERDRLIAQFSSHPDAARYGKITKLVEQISTRLLLPTLFAPQASIPKKQSSSLLPHLEELAPGVWTAGFADRYGSANAGWIALKDTSLLVDLPRGVPARDYVTEVAKLAGQSPRKLILTSLRSGDAAIIETLLQNGIAQVLTSAGIRSELLAAGNKLVPSQVPELTGTASVGDAALPVNVLPLDGIVGKVGAVVHLPEARVMFAGPFVVNGPRAKLTGTDTAAWVATLRKLEKLGAAQVVPGAGTWGVSSLLGRQRRFLTELRRQVGYVIARGRPSEALRTDVRISDEHLVWMPYDNPTAEDIEHVYEEMTVPAAPFNGRPPQKSDSRPHALVLIGDLPHEPGHLEEGLWPMFEATGVVPHFTVDVRALSSQNLAFVPLLVVLRDGLQRPSEDQKSAFMWMTAEQQQAVASFVESGGAFLNLHNSMGLYPDDGPYLKLVGGNYRGHGPLERFRVEVVDRNHPITRGVEDFSVADEQHTPWFDSERVHVLLRNRADNGTQGVAGWVCEPGRGRLCHLANGHTRDALGHPMYQRLLANAINWCLRREGTGPR